MFAFCNLYLYFAVCICILQEHVWTAELQKKMRSGADLSKCQSCVVCIYTCILQFVFVIYIWILQEQVLFIITYQNTLGDW